MPSVPSLRRHSLDAVLAYAWDAEVFTASDVMSAVALTRSTTIDVLDELVARGLLVELPNARAVGEYSKGRPARRFALRADAALVVGVDAGRGHVTATVADLRGVPIATSRLSIDPERDSPERRRRAAEKVVDATLTRAHASRDALVAVCVGVPAPVDRAGRSPVHHDGFWQRMNPDFVDTFASWAPVVRVENDASLAAVAEHAQGAAVGYDDFVALLAGERFGAGLWLDGRLLRGAHGGAGETVAFDRVEGVGSAYGLAPRCVDAARTAIAAGTLPAGSALADVPRDDLDAKRILDLAAAGGPGGPGRRRRGRRPARDRDGSPRQPVRRAKGRDLGRDRRRRGADHRRRDRDSPRRSAPAAARDRGLPARRRHRLDRRRRRRHRGDPRPRDRPGALRPARRARAGLSRRRGRNPVARPNAGE
ncbi:ROK family protein [Microbacterium sp. SLBN-111]|uniref:ROK family protein n=2 Tax=Actinomycetes TaxID=1760 RepID=UPI003C793C9C